MLEAEGLEPESQAAVMDAPVIGQIEKLPFSAALFAAVIMGVGLFPFFSPGGVPDDLRIRTDQPVLSPPLELFSPGSIDYFVIFPCVSNPH